MFIIYEHMDRNFGGMSTKVVGYVNSEAEAKEACAKLNESVKEKNKTNTMASWSHSFEPLNYIDINTL